MECRYRYVCYPSSDNHDSLTDHDNHGGLRHHNRRTDDNDYDSRSCMRLHLSSLLRRIRRGRYSHAMLVRGPGGQHVVSTDYDQHNDDRSATDYNQLSANDYHGTAAMFGRVRLVLYGERLDSGK